MGVNKALGQHWLKNREILDEIAGLAKEGSDSSTADPSVCLEIGPGLGTLTSSLLRRFEKVVAVEFDQELARKLPGSFPGKNLEVINEDILKFDLSALPKGYVAAGNIPYYITSPIIEKLLMAENAPERVVLLIQKEVAERIVSEKQSILSLMVKNRAEAELGPVVLCGEFEPAPEVDSQVIILTPHRPMVEEEVLDLARRGFKAPRKKVTKNLAEIVPREEVKKIFSELNISVDARPAELSLEDWQKIYHKMFK